MRKLLLNIHDKSMKDQLVIINKTVDGWKGDIEKVDEVVVIGVKY
jgi:hypothetical protein